MSFHGDPVRLLIVPGLHDSGAGHWQTWLESHHGRRAVRVRQTDWSKPELDAWAQRIETTLAREPHARWVAVAHSFGCLALLRHLAVGGQGILGALLVAPADPEKFGISAKLPHARLSVPSVVLASETDPWMRFESVCAWARVWGTQVIGLGDAGHVNVESGHGRLPQAKALVELMIQRLERERRIDRADWRELHFAI
jgi:predicted alpha/beta hydrolase family esterase